MPARGWVWRRRAQLWSDRESVEHEEEEGVEQAADVDWGAHQPVDQQETTTWEAAEVEETRQGTAEEGVDEEAEREQEHTAGETETRQGQGPTLRVLNFNAQEYKSEWRRRFRAFGALVKRTKPHVIAVQVRFRKMKTYLTSHTGGMPMLDE